jgi:exodeoxyribonuclease V beta subunit
VARLERLDFEPLRGFLRGYVDLVFRYEGRWYVVDYKSNHLGEDIEDYAAPQLGDVMAEHHYLLQYHLYTVALHRMLQSKEPAYDYESGFGGVLYLFLRGLVPAHAPAHGVYFDRPPVRLIERLSDLFGPVVRPGGRLRREER